MKGETRLKMRAGEGGWGCVTANYKTPMDAFDAIILYVHSLPGAYHMYVPLFIREPWLTQGHCSRGTAPTAQCSILWVAIASMQSHSAV